MSTYYMNNVLNVYNGYNFHIFIAHYGEIVDDEDMLTDIFINSSDNIVEAQKKVYSLAMTTLDDEEKRNKNKANEIMEFAHNEKRMLEALRNIHTTYDRRQHTIKMMSSKANEIIIFLKGRSNRFNRLNQRAAASADSAPATRDAARAAARVMEVRAAVREGAAAGRAPAAAASRHTFASAIGRAPSPASRESWASRAEARAAEADDAIVRQEIALMEDADLEQSIADAEAAAAEEAAEEAAVAAAVAEVDDLMKEEDAARAVAAARVAAADAAEEAAAVAAVDAFIIDEDEAYARRLYEKLNGPIQGGKSRKQKSRKQKSRKQKSRKQKYRKQKSRKQKYRK